MAFALFVSRRPDCLFNAQFYAEDGKFFFADAYRSHSLAVLFHPFAGYLQLVSRLTAVLALSVSFQFAPLLMNIVGLSIQALPVCFILSPRLKEWAPFRLRIVLSLVYIALPNVAELQATVTNAQWHLALLAILVLFAAPAANRIEAMFDWAVLLGCGLTGPFCIFLTPIALVLWLSEKKRQLLVRATVIIVCALVQGLFLLSSTRHVGDLGATPGRFIKLLVSRVYVAAIVGHNSLSSLSAGPLLVIFLGCTAFIAYCFFNANWRWRLWLLYAFAILGASLLSIESKVQTQQWEMLLHQWNMRYMFFPMLAFVWSLAWCAQRKEFLYSRLAAATLLITLLVFLPRTWKMDPFVDLNFKVIARQFQDARFNQSFTIPINPSGWEMEITKK